MTYAEIKKWYAEIKAFTDGGNVYRLDLLDDKWVHEHSPAFREDQIYVVDNQTHFECRKAFAEGKKIEYKPVGSKTWDAIDDPKWDLHCKYRVAKPEPVYEERWRLIKDYDNYTVHTNSYYNEECIAINYTLGEDDWRKGESIQVEIKS